MRQGEVEGRGSPHPGAGAAVGGAPGRGTGLLARHDALPAQDQAQPFHDSRAVVDGTMGCRLGTAAKAGVRCAEFICGLRQLLQGKCRWPPLVTRYLDRFVPRDDAKRQWGQSPEWTTLPHPDMQCRVFILRCADFWLPQP